MLSKGTQMNYISCITFRRFLCKTRYNDWLWLKVVDVLRDLLTLGCLYLFPRVDVRKFHLNSMFPLMVLLLSTKEFYILKTHENLLISISLIPSFSLWSYSTHLLLHNRKYTDIYILQCKYYLSSLSESLWVLEDIYISLILHIVLVLRNVMEVLLCDSSAC